MLTPSRGRGVLLPIFVAVRTKREELVLKAVVLHADETSLTVENEAPTRFIIDAARERHLLQLCLMQIGYRFR